MSRFAKIACALLMVFSLAGAVAPTSAQAHETNFAGVEHGGVHYHVYYGGCVHSMSLYGCYDCPVEAQQVARQLRWNGYVVSISAQY